MKFAAVCTSLALLIACGNNGSQNQQPKPTVDETKLQGAWESYSLTTSGGIEVLSPTIPPDISGIQLSFDKDKKEMTIIRFQENGEVKNDKGKYQLDGMNIKSESAEALLKVKSLTENELTLNFSTGQQAGNETVNFRKINPELFGTVGATGKFRLQDLTKPKSIALKKVIGKWKILGIKREKYVFSAKNFGINAEYEFFENMKMIVKVFHGGETKQVEGTFALNGNVLSLKTADSEVKVDIEGIHENYLAYEVKQDSGEKEMIVLERIN